MTPSNSAIFLGLFAFSSVACAEADADSETSPLATSAAELRGDALSSAQAATALALIDGICGDTWCSGDYDFRFDALRCCADSRSCRLSLELLPREGVVSPKSEYRRTCRTEDFTGFASLVATAPNGYQSLNQDYYFALTDCIAELEAELPR
jgi:hypothetical protein